MNQFKPVDENLSALYEKGMQFIAIDRYDNAKSAFLEMTQGNPMESTGWLGLILCKTKNLTDPHVDFRALMEDADYRTFLKTATAEQLEAFNRAFNTYCQATLETLTGKRFSGGMLVQKVILVQSLLYTRSYEKKVIAVENQNREKEQAFLANLSSLQEQGTDPRAVGINYPSFHACPTYVEMRIFEFALNALAAKHSSAEGYDDEFVEWLIQNVKAAPLLRGCKTGIQNTSFRGQKSAQDAIPYKRVIIHREYSKQELILTMLHQFFTPDMRAMADAREAKAQAEAKALADAKAAENAALEAAEMRSERNKAIIKNAVIGVALVLVLILAVVGIGKGVKAIKNRFTGPETTTQQKQEEKTTEKTTEPTTEEPEAVLSAGFYEGDMGAYTAVKVSKHSASSAYKTSSGKSYDSRLAFDGDTTTSWQENTDGVGEGEWIEAQFTEEKELSIIAIWSGYGKSKNKFDQNCRPKTVDFEFSNREYVEITLQDENGWQYIELSEPVLTTSVKLSVIDAYLGTTYEDLCISEMAFYVK